MLYCDDVNGYRLDYASMDNFDSQKLEKMIEHYIYLIILEKIFKYSHNL
jgi:hypothetical protein